MGALVDDRHLTKKFLAPKRKHVFDYVLDMYASPSSIKLTSVPNGNEGLLQDRLRIRGYFKAGWEGALGEYKK